MDLISGSLRKGIGRMKMSMLQWGQTEGGRYLIVFFVYKRDKSALILSAREMTQGERRRYEQR